MSRERRGEGTPFGASHRPALRTPFPGDDSVTPYRLIVTDVPCKTLGQGEVRYFASMLDAANAFAKATEPYKTVIYDDGCTARELNRDEQRMLENVCNMLGYDVGTVGT
jgi:hypothetical protein